MSQIDKSKFKDSMGRWLTQGLFIDFQYDPTFAVYTWQDQDKEYKGVVYPSLKRLYLESEDVHEYNFATTHLGSWQQWVQMQGNKILSRHIEIWREELDLKLCSLGLQKLLDSADEGNYQAAKYLADRGWNKKRGRPSKQDLEKERAFHKRVDDEFDEDFQRINNVIDLK